MQTLSPEFLSVLDRTIERVGRRYLPGDDRDDFAQDVRLRFLIRTDILAGFQGRSSLATYLHQIVSNLLKDWRSARYGRWRPTTTARSQGRLAITLQRLVERDGLTRDQAVQVVASEGADAGQLRDVAARIAVARSRPCFVPLSPRLPAAGTAPDSLNVSACSQLARWFEGALAELPAGDGRLLARRFCVKVRLEQRRLGAPDLTRGDYKRIKEILVCLRKRAGAVGVDPAAAVELLDRRLLQRCANCIDAATSGLPSTCALAS